MPEAVTPLRFKAVSPKQLDNPPPFHGFFNMSGEIGDNRPGLPAKGGDRLAGPIAQDECASAVNPPRTTKRDWATQIRR